MPTSQNGQTHSNNSSAFADELFEYVWPFYGVGTWRVKIQSIGWTQCYVIFQRFYLNTVVIVNYQILIKMVQFLITETKESDMLKKLNLQKSHKRFDKNAPVVQT